MRASALVAMIVGMMVALSAGAEPASAAEDGAANRLVVEAVGLARAADRATAAEERAALYKRALDALDTVVAEHPGSDLAVKLATGQAIGGLDRAAIDRKWRLSAAELCVARFDRACALDLALGLADKIEDSSQRDSVLLLVVYALSDGDVIAKALAVARRIDDDYYRSWAFSAVIATALRMGDDVTARGVEAQTRQLIERIDDAHLRASAAALFASSQAEGGALDDARASVSRAIAFGDALRDDWELAMFHVDLAEAQYKSGETVKAGRSLARIQKYARRLTVLEDRITVLTQLAWVAAEINAMEVYAQTISYVISANDLIRSDETRDENWMQIAAAQTNAKDGQGALETANKIGTPHLRAQALANAASAQSDAGEIDVAKSILGHAIEQPWRSDSTYGIGFALALIGSAIEE